MLIFFCIFFIVFFLYFVFFFFKQKTAYVMRISDWSSDVCSSDLAGLYVFGLDGRKLQFLPDGLLNNVDLRIATVGGREQVILGASDRGRMGIALYIFDPASTNPANVVRPWGFIRSDVAEPYGFCMGRDRKSTRLNSSH